MDQFFGLFFYGRYNRWMAMPKVVNGKAADKVNILFSRLVPDPRPFPLDEGNRVTAISPGNVFFRKLDDVLVHQFICENK